MVRIGGSRIREREWLGTDRSLKDQKERVGKSIKATKRSDAERCLIKGPERELVGKKRSQEDQKERVGKSIKARKRSERALLGKNRQQQDQREEVA